MFFWFYKGSFMIGQSPFEENLQQPFWSRAILFCLCIGACLTLLPSLAKGADAPSSARIDDVFSMSLEDLLDMEVVTASLRPQPLSETIASTNVITSEQLQAMGARTIYDALAQVPGLTVSGNKGGANKIFSRGMGSRFSTKILLLLDSHILNSPASGDAMSARFDRIPIDNIDRIEVVQGPGSSLYGSNAFLATINIITKKGANIDGGEATARMEFDENGLAVQHYNLLYGKSNENGWQYSVNFNTINGDGVERWVNRDKLGQSGEADSSEENYDINITVSNNKFNFNTRYYKSDAGDAFGIAYILTDNSNLENEHGFVDTSYEFITTPDLVVKVRGSADIWRSNHYYVITNPDSILGYNSYTVEADTYAYTGEIQGSYTGLHKHHIITGINYRFEEVNNTRFWINQIYNPNNWLIPADRDIWAAYINDTFQITNAIQATIAGRYDEYSDFGGSFNPRLGLSWQLSPKYKLKMQYGTAFRAPDFTALYSTTNPLAKPNNDLDPEEITTWEFGLVARFTPQILLQATLFRSEVDDIIGAGAVEPIQWENTDDLTSKGVEVSLRYDITPRLHLSGNYTYAHIDYSITYQQTTVPEQSGSLAVDYQINNVVHFNINSFGQDKGSRQVNDTRSDLSGYIIINTTLTAKLTNHVEIQFSAYNLTDKRYAYPAPANTLVGDYTAPARSFLIGAKYTF
jgi:iron complex outermembrane receptor protein